MKCIKHLLTGEIERVSDDEAARRIREDKLEPKIWQYVLKRMWKAQEGKLHHSI